MIKGLFTPQSHLRCSLVAAVWLMTTFSCFSQDTLIFRPVWKISSCELDQHAGINTWLDTLYTDYNPETEYLELILIEYYTTSASAIWTNCRLHSLSELFKTKGIAIEALTPKTYYGNSADLRRLGKRGQLRTTYLVIHRRTYTPVTFGKD